MQIKNYINVISIAQTHFLFTDLRIFETPGKKMALHQNPNPNYYI